MVSDQMIAVTSSKLELARSNPKVVVGRKLHYLMCIVAIVANLYESLLEWTRPKFYVEHA